MQNKFFQLILITFHTSFLTESIDKMGISEEASADLILPSQRKGVYWFTKEVETKTVMAAQTVEKLPLSVSMPTQAPFKQTISHLKFQHFHKVLLSHIQNVLICECNRAAFQTNGLWRSFHSQSGALWWPFLFWLLNV